MSLARFGVHKPVPVNLLMAAILLAGTFFGLGLRRQFFPEVDPEQVMISLPYPGATPEEIEESLAIKVEDALIEIEEVDELRTTLSEGGGAIMAEIREGADPDKALEEIERAVDRLRDLPEEAEEITVELFEPKLPVIRVSLFGNCDEHVMKQALHDVKDDLRSLPGMGEITLEGIRDYEIRVDVDHTAIIEHGLSLPQIAQVIRGWMREVPGGTVRSSTGNIKIRTMGVDTRALQIREIPIKSALTGDTIFLGDIAKVTDGFVDEQITNRFNGEPAVEMTIFKVGDQDIVKMAEMVRAYVQGRRGERFEPAGLSDRLALVKDHYGKGPAADSHRLGAWKLGASSTRPLPDALKIQANTDLARFVEGRLDLLLRNAMAGGVLVFLTLLAFLNWRVAMWVGIGLITAICGTLVMMWAFNITLNLLTMFGLIVVLGLLVDDAIVVSENIQSRHDRGEPALTAAVGGTDQVAWPVLATVLTSIVAFLPLTFIKGNIGTLLGALPMVVACALTMSLVESLLILPCHMGHSLARRDKSSPSRLSRTIRRFEAWRDHLVMERLVPAYGKFLAFALRRRYLSITCAIAAVVISMGLVKGGRVGFEFLPKSDSEMINVDLRMPIGTPIEATTDMVRLIEETARQEDEVLLISTQIGQATDIETGLVGAAAPHLAQVFIELKYVDERTRTSSEVIRSIRDGLTGKVDDVERLTFDEISGGPAGADISLRVETDDPEVMRAAVDRTKHMLGEFAGVRDIADDNALGQMELRIRLKPAAASLQVTQADVAAQVRGYLYGIDAHVFAERREDIDVRVRADEAARRSLLAIEGLWIISPSGQAVPLSEIASIEENETYATIKRIDRKRATVVTADTDPGISPEDITRRLTDPVSEANPVPSFKAGSSPLDQVRAQFPRAKIVFAGRQEQVGDAFASLPIGFAAAMVMIYVILAFLFSSYSQPVLVLVAVPFAIVGAVWGHLALGFDMTFLSLIGFVALSGIVVNDSLIFVEFFNKERERGLDMFDALVNAGRARLRPIILTTTTTVLGLMPLILETSFQARFLIPMAISIAMGLLSATLLILVVLPCIIMTFDDLLSLVRWCWHGGSPPEGDELASLEPAGTSNPG